MKNLIRRTFEAALLSALMSLSAYADDPSPGYIDFGKFSPSVSGGEFVEVNVNKNLITMVARLAQQQAPEVADAVRGLQHIRVNVIGLNDENRAEVQKRIKAVRAELDTQGWERVVTAQKKDEDVAVYIKTRGAEAVEGVVVTVLDGKKQAVLVNIVGDINPEKIATIGERFDIDPLKKVGASLKK